MENIKINTKMLDTFLNKEEIQNVKEKVLVAQKLLYSKRGAGSDYLGWVDLPKEYDKEEYSRVKKCASKIMSDSEYLIVIGIGGSYLGSRAVIEALSNSFTGPKGVKVIYAGCNLSPVYLNELIELIKDKEVSINVISKSGTTTEPAVSFRLLKEMMENKYGKAGASKRIYATTDKERGALKQLADNEGYESFIIPDDVGGRFSVLTPVGLLPIAAAGLDTDQLLKGALDSMDLCSKEYNENPACIYAAVRNILYRKNKKIELLVNYEPKLHYINEWWKQLFGESEGKDQSGIFPAAVDFTTDLHSMGQYIQDGLRVIFETVIKINKTESDIVLEADKDNLDNLNYLVGKKLSYVNEKALEGTLLAHADGGVPNIVIEIPELNEYYIGQLIYFFEKSCGISGYFLGVNPFNQPGVESYKKNMFALLEKPGFEELTKELKERL